MRHPDRVPDPTTDRVTPPPRAAVDAARLIDQVVDYAIIALDGSGTIESWNAGAQQLKGYTPEEAIGRSFSMFYTDGDRRLGLPLRLLDEARTKGRVESVGWRVRKDGTRFWGDVVITALHDDDGAVVGFAKVTRDLTSEHELAESLRRSEERFRLLVSQVKDYAIIALDPSGTIESWNAGAERLKGYTADEAIGRSSSMFYSEDDRRDGLPLRLLEEARLEGRVRDTGWRTRKDGTRFWGDVVITALHDDDGRLTGFAKLTRDLTEHKELEEAQAKFLGAIAHDFRTPIAAMKGFTELMLDAPDEMQRDFLHRIDANADRLMKMMNDLVGYATVHAIATKGRPELFDLAALASDTVATIASADQLARLVLPQEPAEVVADRASMERVLINLVDNALTYATTGPIVVGVQRVDAWVRLTVADSGRGIAPDDLTGIFDEFERGSLATDDGGTGVGLSSVKSLVEEQGGRVRLESVVGEGTTVTVELPAPMRGLSDG